MKPTLVSFRLCPFVRRSVILMRLKEREHNVVYVDLADPPACRACAGRDAGARAYRDVPAGVPTIGLPQAMLGKVLQCDSRDQPFALSLLALVPDSAPGFVASLPRLGNRNQP